MMKEICIILLFILILPAVVSYPSAGTEPVSGNASALFSAQKINDYEDNDEYFTTSPDSTRVFYNGDTSPNSSYVVVGPEGKINGSPYTSVRNFIFSPNGQHFAYDASVGDKEIVVVDGSEGQKYDKVYDIVFSQDGRRYAYQATKDGKPVMVVDGREEGPYGHIGDNPVISSAGQHVLFYISREGESESHVVVDGEIQEKIGWDPVISPDGSRWAYQRGAAYNGDPTYIVLNGTVIDLGHDKLVPQKVFSLDGKHFAYAWTENGAYTDHTVVVDGVQGKAYPSPGAGKIVFSPDGSRVAYSAKSRGEGYMMVLDGKEGKIYDEVSDPVFSPDSNHVAYIAKDNDSKFVVLDGMEDKRYGSVFGLSFSVDDRLGYVAQNNSDQLVVVDGQEGPHYLADWYGRGIRFGPVFSPDGRHVVYIANDGNKGQYVVVDGVQNPNPWRYMGGLNWGEGSPIIFDSDDEFHYLAVNETGTFIVRAKVSSTQTRKGGNQNNTNPPTVPEVTTIMHPTPKELQKWVSFYKNAPNAEGTVSSASQGYPLAESQGESFSLLPYLQYTPDERNQGECGDCWQWAGTAVMEIQLGYRKDIKDRLSVEYINSNIKSSGQDTPCCGGWLDYLTKFYTDRGQAVSWSNSNAQWEDGSCSCEGGSAVQPDTVSTSPSYSITSIKTEKIPTQGVGRDLAISNIKSVLHQGKAVWFAFFIPNKDGWDDFYNFWNNQKETAIYRFDTSSGTPYDKEGGGHATVIVGYDETDPNNPNWIVLNSWGASSNRPNVLFRVSMDMDYDSQFPTSFDQNSLNAYYFETLDVTYADQGKSQEAKEIFNNWNTGGVGNNPSCSPSFTISEPYMITYVDTYHWNSGSGTATVGTIGLKKDDGTVYGPWNVETTPGQGGVPNANWIAHPNEVIPAGTYEVIDSDPASWSQNSESNGCGFSKVEGYPEGKNQVSPIILTAGLWTVKELGPQGNYYGTWTRRPGTDTFDASWSGGSITDVIDITSVEGNTITLHRHGNNGDYTGTISPDGTGISGTASWYVPGETWTVTRNDALGKIGKPAVESLIQASKDNDSSVRLGAVGALSYSLFSSGEEDVNDTRDVEPLIEALKDSDEGVRSTAKEALTKLRWQQSSAYGQVSPHKAEPVDAGV